MREDRRGKYKESVGEKELQRRISRDGAAEPAKAENDQHGRTYSLDQHRRLSLSVSLFLGLTGEKSWPSRGNEERERGEGEEGVEKERRGG
jgi:hypothetical protein